MTILKNYSVLIVLMCCLLQCNHPSIDCTNNVLVLEQVIPRDSNTRKDYFANMEVLFLSNDSILYDFEPAFGASRQLRYSEKINEFTMGIFTYKIMRKDEEQIVLVDENLDTLKYSMVSNPIELRYDPKNQYRITFTGGFMNIRESYDSIKPFRAPYEIIVAGKSIDNGFIDVKLDGPNYNLLHSELFSLMRSCDSGKNSYVGYLFGNYVEEGVKFEQY